MSILFDAHCHATRKISAPVPSSPDGAARGRLVCGVSGADWPVVADWAVNWPGTVPAFGIHPWESGSADGTWEQALEERLLRFPSAWVGEIGLDRAKQDRATIFTQIDVFGRQLRLAARLGRGVNLHCVRKDDWLLDLLDNKYFALCAPGAGKCILHSFSGSQQALRRFVDRGVYFSVGPPASRRDSPKARARFERAPAERILVESDAFLDPGVDAEEDLLFTLRWLAGVKGMDAGVLARTVADNAQRILDGTD